MCTENEKGGKRVEHKSESDGSALVEAKAEVARLRAIIKKVWETYENPSQIWWDSGLLAELQDIAEEEPNASRHPEGAERPIE